MTSRSRICCTLGPCKQGGRRAQDADDYVDRLVTAGMDVARINLSHARGAASFLAGDAPDYTAETTRLTQVRAASDRAGPARHVATMLDLQGIKIRLYLPKGRRRNGLEFEAGATLRMRLTAQPEADELACDASVRVQHALREHLARHGDVEVAIADGDPLLACIAVEGDVAVLRAPDKGTLFHRKGVTFRGVDLPDEPPLPPRDRIDLAAFALPAILRGDADLLALSFTRSAADVDALRAFCRVAAAYFRDGTEPEDTEDRELLASLAARRPDLASLYGPGDVDALRIVAKLETRSGTENLDGILRAADAVMIARGDLGLQCRPEDVPRLQKDIIRRARLLGRPAVVATQMLGSMEHAPEPTRAEASDVFNAVVDGADALMLSGETALGSRPQRAVETLRAIADTAAEWNAARRFGRGMRLNHLRMDLGDLRREWGQTASWIEVSDRLTVEAVRIAEGLDAVAIVAVTRSGETARNIARFDPLLPVVAIVPDASVARSLALTGSVCAVVVPDHDGPEALEAGLRGAVVAGFLEPGQRVLVAGARSGDPPGATSAIRIRLV